MTSTARMDDDLREKIIARPSVILDDQDVMRALIDANEKTMGGNIVDLRGIAMERLETRLDRLEDTHRSVIAAAYENLAGTNQVHRAILRMLDPADFEGFLCNLAGEVADILRVDTVRLVLESEETADEPIRRKLGAVLSVAAPGFVGRYVSEGRLDGAAADALRPVTLRQIPEGAAVVYGEKGEHIRSEALLALDLGTKRLPGLLALGSEDPHMFAPQQGSDLLAFFAGVFERSMRRWLA